MESRQERFVRAQALRKKYASIGMPGVAKVVDYLGSKSAEGLIEFGSSSIGPNANGMLYIGRPQANPPMTPLEDLEQSLPVFTNMPSEARDYLDGILGSIADTMTSSKKLRNRIPTAFRHWLIGVFRKFNWPVSEEMGMGSKWWWLPWVNKAKHRHYRFDTSHS